MSTAVVEAVGALEWPFADEQPAGVVTVSHRTPTCSCGWTGRRRAALFLARHDAWMHAAITGCTPGVPLVLAR